MLGSGGGYLYTLGGLTSGIFTSEYLRLDLLCSPCRSVMWGVQQKLSQGRTTDRLDIYSSGITVPASKELPQGWFHMCLQLLFNAIHWCVLGSRLNPVCLNNKSCKDVA